MYSVLNAITVAISATTRLRVHIMQYAAYFGAKACLKANACAK
jgi:hypothetical protein